MTVPHIYLAWPAVCDLRAMPWDDERELGGVVMGRLDGDQIRISEVHPNPSGPAEPTSTHVEFGEFLGRETVEVPPSYKGKRRSRLRICGSIHSHCVVGPPQASEADLRFARRGSMIDKQDGQTFCILIVSPRSEIWEAGYPVGLDWENAHLGAWVAVRGEVTSATVTQQPDWQWRIEDEHPELRAREETNAQ